MTAARPCPRCARPARWLAATCATSHGAYRRMVSACCYVPLPWANLERAARGRRERLTRQDEVTPDGPGL